MNSWNETRLVNAIESLRDEVKALCAEFKDGHNSTGCGGLSDKEVEKGPIPLCPTTSDSMYQTCGGCLTPLLEGPKCEVCSQPHEYIWDGFGGVWGKQCAECNRYTMQVVRPGKVQCGNCG